MFFLKPSVRKRAHILTHHLRRYVNFKRDLLSVEQRGVIETQLERIAVAKKSRISRDEFSKIEKRINEECGNFLPKEGRDGLGETVETIIVVATLLLGIKTYLVQPFKIPTNSMLPTLNGVVAEYQEELPGGLQQISDAVLAGKRYVEFRAEGPLDLTKFNAPQYDPAESEQDRAAHEFNGGRIVERTMKFLGLLRPIGLFNYSVLKYDDGKESRAFYMPPSRLAMLIMQTARKTGKYSLAKGDLLAKGAVKTGDHVLVNKFAYHFRKPTRGEVFVFTTEGLATGEVQLSTRKPLVMHYIKRLVGLPGDQIRVRPPELKINGKEPEEFGIKRVSEADRKMGYYGYTRGYRTQLVTPDGWSVYEVPEKLADGQPGYFAMGDNSANSKDSREIGAVPEGSLVGPALMCYWPLFPHFGLIR